MRTLSPEQVAILRKAVRAWEDRPAALRGVRSVTLLPEIVDTMLGTGLRIGECLALREEDVVLDGDDPTLTVTGTVTRAEVVGADGSPRRRLTRQEVPKTDASQRTITLPRFVVAAIQAALDVGLDGGPDGLVFPSAKGTPRAPGRVRDQLRLALMGTGVVAAPHDFRRTVATRVAAETRSVTSAKELLGHTDEATTIRHYVRRTGIAPDLRSVLDGLVAEPEGPKPGSKP